MDFSIFDKLNFKNDGTPVDNTALIDNLLNSSKFSSNSESIDFFNNENINSFRSVDQVKPTIYIITSRIGFRPDAIKNALSKTNYNIEDIYIENGNIPSIAKPLCFIIDIGDEVYDSVVQQSLLMIKKKAVDNNAGFFLLGHSENVEFFERFIKDDIIIRSFIRPLDMGNCIKEIESIIVSGETTIDKKHLFIVDQDINVLNKLRKLLKGNYRISTLSNPMECIKKLAVAEPDMIITEYYLPVCHCSDFIQMIKEEYPLLPVIIHTTNDNTSDMINMMPLGINGYIIKKQNNEDIIRFINNYFRAD